MRDRVSRYPGRVRLAPVAGQENVFDVTHADEPIEEGSLLNKANLLPDNVCGQLGIANTSELKDALAALRNLITTATVVTGLYTGDGKEERDINLGFYPRAVILLRQELNVKDVWASDTYTYGGLALRTSEAQVVFTDAAAVSIVNTGFRVYQKIVHSPSSRYWAATNTNTYVYHYLAWR